MWGEHCNTSPKNKLKRQKYTNGIKIFLQRKQQSDNVQTGKHVQAMLLLKD